jgi:uncharacterized oxidoreductase
MKTTNNTILITGGSAGIGFEMAKLFSENGNQVIITGRSQERIAQAISRLKNTSAIVSDVSNAKDIEKLVAQLNKDFPRLNIVINNAGSAHYYDMTVSGINAFDKASEEILTNYLSIIRLNELLLPLLKQQSEAAIVNVSSIVAFAARANSLPTYGASKAALHSYTNSLRIMMEDTPVKVFELMPPLVDTGFSAAIGGAANGIPPKQVADDLLTAMQNDEFEIHVGNTADIFNNFFPLSPKAVLAMNGKTKRMERSMEEEQIPSALNAHWQASADGDANAEHDIYDDDAICDYPQSGERILGRSNLQALRSHHPGKPSGFHVKRILGKGDLWITEYTITYQGRPAYTVSIMEFRNGKVVHETQYFADPFEAPAWRSQWVQQIARR